MTSVPDTAPQGAVLRYSNTAVTFHWITAALVLVQAYLGFRFGLSEPGPARDEIFIWHKSVGALILLLVLARLAYRVKNPPPPFPPELSAFELVHMETPTYVNPLGAKGFGESGTIGAIPAVQNAVIDALSHLGVRHIDMPVTPERVWRALGGGDGTAAE